MAEESEFSPDELHQLDEWIDEGKDLPISHSSLCLKIKEGDVIAPYQSLICRYYYTILPFTHEITLSDKDYLKYKNNPKLLSQDLYDTPELWSSLMYINNIVSIADFKKKKLRVFGTDIMSKLEELLVLAEEDIMENKSGLSE